MTITITFTGFWPDIQNQMRDMLGLVRGPVPIIETAPANRSPAKPPASIAATFEAMAEEACAEVDAEEAELAKLAPPPEPEPVKPAAKAKTPPKTYFGRKAPPSAPEAPPVAKEPEKAPEPPTLSPAALIDLRAKTLSELQAAYANGKQQAVFKLLAEYGNGAKSFRELQLEDFPPLRKALDAGALA